MHNEMYALTQIQLTACTYIYCVISIQDDTSLFDSGTLIN
jgi:hypothetical protein